MTVFGTYELEAKLGSVRENDEFGFGFIVFESLVVCFYGNV